jgi:hypothetical protein
MHEQSYRPSKGFIAALVFIGVLVVFAAWSGAHVGVMASQIRSMSNLRQIGMALLGQAEANQGKLPPLLSQLSPKFVAPSALPLLGFRDPDSKRLYDWLYYPRTDLTNLPPETILAASPTAVPRGNHPPQRIVLHRDGSVAFIPDTEFLELISKQQKGAP